MSSVNEIEKKINEIIDFLENLQLERTDIDIAIFNMKSSLRKMLVEYSKDYPNDEALGAYKRFAEKDGIYGEYVASMYNSELRDKYVLRMQVASLADKYRALVLTTPLPKCDERLIALLADYKFLLALKEKAMLLLFELTEKEKEKLMLCEEFIAESKAS